MSWSAQSDAITKAIESDSFGEEGMTVENIGKPKQFEITEVRHTTGVWLEEGQKYEITALPRGPGDDNYQTTACRDDDCRIVSPICRTEVA
jgi:hypothetical protein